MRLILAGIFAGVLFSQEADCGAWTLPEGDAQGIATLQYSFAADAFDETGSLRSTEPFEKFELRGYFEYGLTDAVTLVLEPQLRRKSQGDEQTDGLSRVAFGGRARVWKNDTAVASVGGAVSAPGQTDSLVALNGSDTEWEVEGRFLLGLGYELFNLHGFVDAQVGYRHRLQEPADEIIADLTIGLNITERSLVMVQSFNTLSVGDARAPFTETQEHKLVSSSVYRLSERLSLQTGAIVTGFGRNVLREQGVFISVWRSF